MKKWGIIGAVAFFTAVAVGFSCKFDASVIIEIDVAAFGFTAFAKISGAALALLAVIFGIIYANKNK